MKDGPSKGKTFKVPTIPIACDHGAPHMVYWIIVVFHSFKGHLNPVTLDPASGRVLPGWLCLYQNNINSHSTSSESPSKDEGPPFTFADNTPSSTVPVSDPPPGYAPSEFSGPLYVPGPLSKELPPRTLSVVKLVFAGSSPFYLGVTRDHTLHTTTSALHAQVVSTLKLPADPSVPTAHP
ncbi:hypothetical protein EDD16DRAFT_1524064 [Pisolithus croceorrhizus]|nr:hypothetical protein EDD16DRAFT_1524064 [Pisolithus croceorrhizus]KAI6107421.1 hypothetical protein EV401DRAFT_1892051 [Pisolithus croceorrhizus]KAI6142916.1 hypothetical protein EDD17DRAFT_1515667 [Pisolithus thermaeus]